MQLMSQLGFRRIAACLIVTASMVCGLFAATPVQAVEKPYVYIDAGHGGPYSNANENGLSEKNVNLMIALELKQRLESMGYRVGIDRTTDVAVCMKDIPTWHSTSAGFMLYADGSVPVGVPTDDLQARANLANSTGADIFIAIHCNGVTDRSVTGFESFAPSFDPLGQQLSAVVQQQVVSDVGFVDRGDKLTDFYVIRWANMPAVLVEAGFLSNPAEAAKLGSPVFRWRLARSIATGIDRFFAQDPFQAVYPRFNGSDRYDTAAKLSQEGWPSGARTVLLASGRNWPDGLAAAPLSRKLDAPLLLTEPGVLPVATRNELARLHPSEIVVLGGEPSVSATAAAEATAAAQVGTETVTARRIGGATRYDTAAMIAQEVGVPSSGRIAIVSGTGFVDALSAAPYAGRNGMPILLANGATLPEATRSFIATRQASIRNVFVAGGTASVPQSALTGLPVTRVSGPDRWSTNAAIARLWTSGTLTPLVANGLDFPDGVAAGSYCAKTGQPLLLVPPRALPDRTREFIGLGSSRLTGFKLVGSPIALSRLLEWELDKAR